MHWTKVIMKDSYGKNNYIYSLMETNITNMNKY